MRLLFLTNFYPPASRGGYEQWCQEVAEGLRNRGHEVFVLTSTHDINRAQLREPDWVRRELHLEMELASLKNAFQFFTSRKKREDENLERLQKVIENCSPDVVLIWGMWNLPWSLPVLAERLMPGRVVYYFGDYWTTLPSQFENYWNAPARNIITGLPKMILKIFARRSLAKEKRPGLLIEHALFPSAFMRDELARKGISPKYSRIIYGGINTSPYTELQNHPPQTGTTSILYVGRLTHEKGVHTAIQAMGFLVNEQGLKNLHLTIVGDGDADYVKHLHQVVEQNNIVPFVTFMPAQPKDALPDLYHRSDIVLFTSIWAEPFGRVIVEAMASGIAVAGTAVGGASEILVDGENALTFIPDDPKDLRRQLKRLIESPELRERLAKAGCKTALENFDIHRMTQEIESYLQTLTD